MSLEFALSPASPAFITGTSVVRHAYRVGFWNYFERLSFAWLVSRKLVQTKVRQLQPLLLGFEAAACKLQCSAIFRYRAHDVVGSASGDLCRYFQRDEYR
jgi:hypothetical protein